MSVQTQIDRLNTIKERIRTNLVAQGITVPADSMLEDMATQILSVAGEDGQRGPGLLAVTTAPSSYTTEVGGITPKYRMALSTIKSQSGVTEVLLGDTIRYSYYHYPIDYLDASYAYCTTRVSIRGATGAAGTSVTHEWDGTTLTITSASGTSSADLRAPAGGVIFGHWGKKILFMGDSITQLAAGWSKQIQDILKPSRAINVAVTGARLVDYAGTVYDGNPVYNGSDNNVNNVFGNQVEKIVRGVDSTHANYSKVSDYEEFDVIFVAFGTNDNMPSGDIETSFYSDGAVVGINSVNRTTWHGAFRYGIEKLQKLYPSAKIFVCTPIQGADATKSYSSIKTKGDYLKNLCARMSVHCIDTMQCGICSIYEVSGANGRDLRDGLHPNESGALKIAKYNAAAVANVFAAESTVNVYEPDTPPAYTNVLKQSVGTDKNPYNGGKGWKADTYLSANGLTESSSTNYDVTGFIPVNKGDIIRLKNVQLCKTVGTASKCVVAVVKSDFSANTNTNWLTSPSQFTAAWNAVTNDAGTDVVQFTVPTSLNNVAYIRLCCGELTDDSIITVNEEID